MVENACRAAGRCGDVEAVLGQTPDDAVIHEERRPRAT